MLPGKEYLARPVSAIGEVIGVWPWDRTKSIGSGPPPARSLVGDRSLTCLLLNPRCQQAFRSRGGFTASALLCSLAAAVKDQETGSMGQTVRPSLLLVLCDYAAGTRWDSHPGWRLA